AKPGERVVEQEQDRTSEYDAKGAVVARSHAGGDALVLLDVDEVMQSLALDAELALELARHGGADDPELRHVPQECRTILHDEPSRARALEHGIEAIHLEVI